MSVCVCVGGGGGGGKEDPGQQLNLQKTNGLFQRKPKFSKVGGLTFPGGIQHLPGEWGPIVCILLETHITCDFQGGGGLDTLSL